MTSESQYPAYKYSPLPSPSTLRLVQLYPAAEFSDPLEFEFILHDRYSSSDDVETFHNSVSYVWGNAEFTHNIYCRSAGRYLKITPRVDVMLRQLRVETVERIWIDAICLNQEDTAEKNVQVPLMGEIYHQARNVHIWLGPADPQITKAFKFLQAIALQSVQAGTNPGIVESVLKESCGSESLDPVRKLLHLSWFQRRWVIQEASLSHETSVHCGPSSIRWPWFADGLGALQQLREGLEFDQTALNALRVSNAIRRDPGTLLQILWEFHSTVCYDPRDRIFAIYGLAADFQKDSARSALGDSRGTVDYSRHWTETYTSLAEYLVQDGGLVEILRHLSSFGSLRDVNPLWPSWVPDWSKERRPQYDFPSTIDIFDFPEVTQKVGYKGIEIHGKKIGTASLVAGPWPRGASIPEIATHVSAHFHQWESEFSDEEEFLRNMLAMLCLGLRRIANSGNVYANCFGHVDDDDEEYQASVEEVSLASFFALLMSAFDVEAPVAGDAADVDEDEVEREKRHIEELIDAAMEGGEAAAEEVHSRHHAEQNSNDSEEENPLVLRTAAMRYFSGESWRDRVQLKLGPVLEEIDAMMDGQRVFYVERYYSGDAFAIGHHDVQVDDMIIQLAKERKGKRGSASASPMYDSHSLCFILRPVKQETTEESEKQGKDEKEDKEEGGEKKEEMFRYIGYCYVNGITDDIDDMDTEPVFLI